MASTYRPMTLERGFESHIHTVAREVRRAGLASGAASAELHNALREIAAGMDTKSAAAEEMSASRFEALRRSWRDAESSVRDNYSNTWCGTNQASNKRELRFFETASARSTREVSITFHGNPDTDLTDVQLFGHHSAGLVEGSLLTVVSPQATAARTFALAKHWSSPNRAHLEQWISNGVQVLWPRDTDDNPFPNTNPFGATYFRRNKVVHNCVMPHAHRGAEVVRQFLDGAIALTTWDTAIMLVGDSNARRSVGVTRYQMFCAVTAGQDIARLPNDLRAWLDIYVPGYETPQFANLLPRSDSEP